MQGRVNVLLIHERKVLLIRSSPQDPFYFPGRVLVENEDPLIAARDVVSKEFHVSCTVERELLSVLGEHGITGEKERERLFLIRPEQEVILPPEGIHQRWFSLSDLKDYSDHISPRFFKNVLPLLKEEKLL